MISVWREVIKFLPDPIKLRYLQTRHTFFASSLMRADVAAETGQRESTPACTDFSHDVVTK